MHLPNYVDKEIAFVRSNDIMKHARGKHVSRLGFVTPSIGEVSMGPLGNTHHKNPWKQMTSELVTR